MHRVGRPIWVGDRHCPRGRPNVSRIRFSSPFKLRPIWEDRVRTVLILGHN